MCNVRLCVQENKGVEKTLFSHICNIPLSLSPFFFFFWFLLNTCFYAQAFVFSSVSSTNDIGSTFSVYIFSSSLVWLSNACWLNALRATRNDDSTITALFLCHHGACFGILID